MERSAMIESLAQHLYETFSQDMGGWQGNPPGTGIVEWYGDRWREYAFPEA